MGGIVLRLKKSIGRLPRGNSKLFGSPDVWPGFEWPCVTNSGECYDLHFVAQINCAEAAICDKSGLLPTGGMLYFFYDFDYSPSESNCKNAARVIYYNGSFNELHELMMVDEDGVDCAVSLPQPISFVKTSKAVDKARLKMCSQDEDELEYIVLLSIDSFSVLNGEVLFNGLGKMHFLIEKERLLKQDFSQIKIKHIFN